MYVYIGINVHSFLTLKLTFEFKTQIAWTQIPYNFILDKEELTRAEWEIRYRYEGANAVFDKSVSNPEEGRAPPTAAGKENYHSSPLEEWKERYKYLRKMILDYGRQRIMETFMRFFRAATANNPQFRDCKTFEDVLEAYGRENTPETRHAVHLAYEKAISKLQMLAIEKDVMNKIRVTYVRVVIDERSGEAKKTKTRREGGSVVKMLQRLKQQMIMDKLRYSTSCASGQMAN
jgi:hypothetical protein